MILSLCHDAAFHHKSNIFQRAYVLQFAGHGDHVRELACFQRAHVLGVSYPPSRAAGGGVVAAESSQISPCRRIALRCRHADKLGIGA